MYLLVGQTLLAQDRDNRRPRDNDSKSRLLNGIFRAPRGVTLTEEQTTKLKALHEKHGSELAAKLLEI